MSTELLMEMFKQCPALVVACYCIWFLGKNSDKILDVVKSNAVSQSELSVVNRALTCHIENNTKVIEKCHIRNENKST